MHTQVKAAAARVPSCQMVGMPSPSVVMRVDSVMLQLKWELLLQSKSIVQPLSCTHIPDLILIFLALILLIADNYFEEGSTCNNCDMWLCFSLNLVECALGSSKVECSKGTVRALRGTGSGAKCPGLSLPALLPGYQPLPAMASSVLSQTYVSVLLSLS